MLYRSVTMERCAAWSQPRRSGARAGLWLDRPIIAPRLLAEYFACRARESRLELPEAASNLAVSPDGSQIAFVPLMEGAIALGPGASALTRARRQEPKMHGCRSRAGRDAGLCRWQALRVQQAGAVPICEVRLRC